VTKQSDSELAERIVKLGPDETLTVMGRCRHRDFDPLTGKDLPRCKFGKRSEVHRVALFPADNKYGNKPEPGRLPETEGHRWVGMMAVLRQAWQYPGALPECPDHPGMMRWEGLRALHAPSVACSGDCEKATGSECKCSCNGANHGVLA
jgi:hypothetical protein